MEYRILGKTGLRVSRVGFGGIPIQRIDAAGTKALVERLLEAGVNYIDTARGYTVSESYLGEALEGVREDVYKRQPCRRAAIPPRSRSPRCARPSRGRTTSGRRS